MKWPDHTNFTPTPSLTTLPNVPPCLIRVGLEALYFSLCHPGHHRGHLPYRTQRAAIPYTEGSRGPPAMPSYDS